MSQLGLELSGVSKHYPQRGRTRSAPALTDLNLKAYRGEVVGLLGPNGSGKSTALKIILGLCRPDSGSGSILGMDLGAASALAKTGYLPERDGFVDHLSAYEILRSWCVMNGRRDLGDRQSILKWLETVGLGPEADQRPETFSKGMRQRLSMAQALILEPEVVLLDEPFSGVDPLGVDLLIQLIRNQAKRGAVVVLTSHLLGRVEDVCDFVALLDSGRVIAQGNVADLVGPTGPRPRSLEDVYRERMNAEAVS